VAIVRRNVLPVLVALACVHATAFGDEIIVEWEGHVVIPDNDPPGVFVELTVDPDPNGHNTISDLDLGVLIPHTWQGDLTFWLEHVDSGRMFRVLDRPGAGRFGFSADNYGNPQTRELFLLDDEADNPYDIPWFENPGLPNVTGRWQPDTDPLSGFDGDSIVGRWRFWAEDQGGGDIGAIERISLQFTTIPAPATVTAFILLRAGRRRQNR
jgi:hypothetical protein